MISSFATQEFIDIILSEKKKLVGEQEQSRLEYFTAKECCSQLAEEHLQMVYEKARYSNKEIQREEVNLCRLNI